MSKYFSQHIHSGASVNHKMVWVLLASCPGVVALTLYFGCGTLLNLAAMSILCLGFEAGWLVLRQQKVKATLQDGSALVTGWLLALALPPYCPWWLWIAAAFIAIILAKQVFGGLGLNMFNPAMAAYAFLLVSCPIPMSQWPTPVTIGAMSTPSLATAFQLIMGFGPIDGWSSATALDLLKHQQGQTIADFYRHQPLFSQGSLAASGWEWVNLAFLMGGLLLLFKRIIPWQTPFAFLASLSLLAAWGYDGGSSNSTGSPLFHLLSGGTLLGAFFIITDPVTGAASNRGRLVFGASVGVLTFAIRIWGNLPDGLAFAVLITNFFTPLIDRYTLPKAFGKTGPKAEL